MSVERDALLNALPRVCRKGPDAVAALVCTYVGPGSLSIAVTPESVDVVGEDGAPTSSLPRTGTLAELALALSGVSAVSCQVAEGAEALRAAVLLDAPAMPCDGDGLTLFRWSSTTWQLIEAIRPQLEAAAAKIDVGVAQMNLLRARGDFADFWGRFTGLVREQGELDEAYTLRQWRELLRPRENNQALAARLEAETGVLVEDVGDLEREIFVCSGTPMEGFFLAGGRYNAATCEVRVDGFPGGAVAYLAEQHAAAGVTVFVTGTLDLDGTDSDLDIGSSDVLVGDPPPMQIGVTAIGIGRIGS